MVSKSGATTEAIANFEIIFEKLAKKFENLDERVVAVTDESSILWQGARDRKLKILAIPKPVGGRFSVFSAAGLLPLAAAGVDVADLRKGAAAMNERCLAS